MGVLDADTRRWWPPLSVPSFANADIAPAASANSIQQLEALILTPTTSPSFPKNAARSSSVISSPGFTPGVPFKPRMPPTWIVRAMRSRSSAVFSRD